MSFDTTFSFEGTYGKHGCLFSSQGLIAALGALASLGWRIDISMTKDTCDETITIRLSHTAWHSTLSTPSAKAIYGDPDSKGIQNIYRETIQTVADVQELWKTFGDMVFEYDYLSRSYKEESNSIERRHFHDVKNGLARVVNPIRMSPVYALPGFPGHPDIKEYLLEAGRHPVDSGAPGLLETLIDINGSFPMARGSMLRLSLFPKEWYSGEEPVVWQWQSSMFLHGVVKGNERRSIEPGCRFTDTTCPFAETDYVGRGPIDILLETKRKADFLYQRLLHGTGPEDNVVVTPYPNRPPDPNVDD